MNPIVRFLLWLYLIAPSLGVVWAFWEVQEKLKWR